MSITQPNETEEPEGLGEADDAALGEYPLDTLSIRTEQRSVFEVVRRINNEGFIMDPEFQRDFLWPQDKQSKLIESVLMRIPLPVFYLAEDGMGRTIVVDGLQRLSTFQNFLENKVRLHLPSQTLLHRKYFKELSPKLRNRLRIVT